jgi:hypothetical protein
MIDNSVFGMVTLNYSGARSALREYNNESTR